MQATHSSSMLKYVGVFVALAIVTAIEVGIAFAVGPTSALMIPVLAVAAVVKIALIALFFMHLRDDTKWFALLFMYPFLLAGLLIFWTVFPA